MGQMGRMGRMFVLMGMVLVVVGLAWGQGVDAGMDPGAPALGGSGFDWGALLGLLSLGVVAVWHAFRSSPLWERLGTKQRIVARIIAIAVQAAWKAWGGSAKKAASAEGKLSPQAKAQLMSKAKVAARSMAAAYGVEELPEITDDALLEGAIEQAVLEAKAVAGQAPKVVGQGKVWSKGRPG